mgnify:CR=1 FL=1
MSVLMVGVDESTKGGMWTVVENYLNSENFVKDNDLVYIPTSITGCSPVKKVLFTLKSFYKIRRVYKMKEFNILHAHMSERSSIVRKRWIMKYAKKHGSKIVLHMHGAEFEVLYKAMTEEQKKKVRDTLELADRILILGEYWSDFIGGLVKQSSKVVVLYNAINVPNEYLYSKNSNSILFLGAISKRKGINELLQALDNISDQLKDKYVVSIYGPDVEGNVNSKIENHRLEKWVKYCGWLDKDNKPSILASTAINVLPSYNEGLPMTILEAMSYGIPSVTTNVAAIPEAVNSTNGILVSPGNIKELEEALLKIALDDDFRYNLSKKSYEDAKEKFSVEKHILQVQKIYKELV